MERPIHNEARAAATPPKWRVKLPRLRRRAAKGASRGGLSQAMLVAVAAVFRPPLEYAVRRLRGYRPTPKHITIAVLVLVVVLRPWLIPGILLVAFMIFLISYLTLGPDRFAELAVEGWARLKKWRPDLADKLHQKYERFSMRANALLSRLPNGWKERLSYPWFMRADTATVEDDGPDPFERLAEEARRET